MGEPHLGTGQVEAGGEVGRFVPAGLADAGLMAEQVAGKAGLADLGQGDQKCCEGRTGAPIRVGEGIEPGGDLANAERALGEQAVEGLIEPRRGLEAALGELRATAGGIGACCPVMTGGGELIVAGAGGDIGEMARGGGIIA
jgi:hypothetical protein